MRHLWLPAAALVGILIFTLWPKTAPVVAASEPVQYSPGTMIPDPTPTVPTAAATDSASAPAPASPANKPLRELIPTKSALRAEIEQDPHATPKAILKFSVDIYAKMKIAKANEPAARNLLGELRGCALDHEGAQSIQALCLLNAKRLAKQYPGFKDDYHSLEDQTDPRVVKIMSSMPL